MKNTYEKSWVAVDAVIFTIQDGALLCYLRTREKEPFKGKLELLGGLIYARETAKETLSRKLTQNLPDEHIYFQQFHTFTAVDRDPRERAVSIAYIALVSANTVSNLNDWYPYNKLKDLAFDHQQILKEAYAFLRENVSTLIVKQFMPQHFALNELQKAYEVIEGKTYDNRNFRKKMIQSGIVKETKKQEKDVSHRPATLYRFTAKK